MLKIIMSIGLIFFIQVVTLGQEGHSIRAEKNLKISNSSFYQERPTNGNLIPAKTKSQWLNSPEYQILRKSPVAFDTETNPSWSDSDIPAMQDFSFWGALSPMEHEKAFLRAIDKLEKKLADGEANH